VGQIKIYALSSELKDRREALSQAIHKVICGVLGLPEEKRFHRFIGLAEEDFLFPDSKPRNYTILEIQMIQGRSKETKKALIQGLFDQLKKNCHLSAEALEIVLVEAPSENWGFRGKSAEELALGYKI
jgi:4-oxalocrotonate tautomerase family enzyme